MDDQTRVVVVAISFEEHTPDHDHESWPFGDGMERLASDTLKTLLFEASGTMQDLQRQPDFAHRYSYYLVDEAGNKINPEQTIGEFMRSNGISGGRLDLTMRRDLTNV